MAESMRKVLDDAIAESMADGVLTKKHLPTIEAARICASMIDHADEPNASMLTTMLNYCRALGLAPTNEAIDRRRRKRSAESALDGMRKSFHVA